MSEENHNDPETENTHSSEEKTHDEAKHASTGGSREAFDELGKALKRAWKVGAEDARRGTREALPKAKEEFARGLHDIAWGVSYLASFGATLAREITPDCVDNGWEEGARAGKKAAEAFAGRQARKNETDGPEEEPPVDPENLPVLV